MRVMYIDCFSGMSGDMVIGALIDVGADFNYLQAELKKLKFAEEYDLTVKKVNKQGITSTKFDCLLHEQKTHDHNHAHRSYTDIVEMIEQSTLTDSVKELAIKIFTRIGKAEGLIHGQPLADVHFHEVGAVDSIVDIVGAAILFDSLEIEKVISAPVPLGSGKIKIDHGVYPVPAPATLEIVRGIPIAKSDVIFELTTPTGAAIVAEIATEFGTLPTMTIDSIGYGAGTKDFSDRPNVLRLMMGEI